MDAITQPTRGAKIMDIVKRLKAKPPKGFVTSPLMIEAATEIERLREALQKISAIEDEHINPPTTPSEANLWRIIEGCVRVAEKALGGE